MHAINMGSYVCSYRCLARTARLSYCSVFQLSAAMRTTDFAAVVGRLEGGYVSSSGKMSERDMSDWSDHLALTDCQHRLLKYYGSSWAKPLHIQLPE